MFDVSTGSVKSICSEVEFRTVTVSIVGIGSGGLSNTENCAHETETESLLPPALQVPEKHDASKRSSNDV